MHVERFNSAYRLGIGIALMYVLWMLFPNALSFARQVVGNARQSQTVNAAQRQKVTAAKTVNAAQGPKLTAANLESAMRQTKQFEPASQLRCEPAGQHWDYVCSYIPTPRQSTTRLQFGVNVDATSWVKVSAAMPMGTTLPRPQ